MVKNLVHTVSVEVDASGSGMIEAGQQVSQLLAWANAAEDREHSVETGEIRRRRLDEVANEDDALGLVEAHLEVVVRLVEVGANGSRTGAGEVLDDTSIPNGLSTINQ